MCFLKYLILIVLFFFSHNSTEGGTTEQQDNQTAAAFQRRFHISVDDAESRSLNNSTQVCIAQKISYSIIHIHPKQDHLC